MIILDYNIYVYTYYFLNFIIIIIIFGYVIILNPQKNNFELIVLNYRRIYKKLLELAKMKKEYM